MKIKMVKIKKNSLPCKCARQRALPRKNARQRYQADGKGTRRTAEARLLGKAASGSRQRYLRTVTRWALDNVLGWGLRVEGILRVS